MNREDAARVDRSLVRAMLSRMQAQHDPDALRQDLARVRSLIERTGAGDANEVLADVCLLVASRLPEGDEERAALEKEAQRLKTKEQPREQYRPPPRRYGETRLGPDQRDAIELDETQDWPLPPPFPGDWRTLDRSALVDAVERADRAYGGQIALGIFLKIVAGRAAATPYYPGFELVELLWARGDGHLESLLFLLGEDAALWLTGVSTGIHALNAGAVDGAEAAGSGAPVESRSFLDLSDAANAEGYLRFFCAMVTGEEGPFHIIGDTPELARHWVDGEVPEAIAGLIEPVVVERIASAESSDGSHALEVPIWRAEACVAYARVLFRASFVIQRGGMVEMSDDEPLVQDEMPLTQERYAAGGRIAGARHTDGGNGPMRGDPEPPDDGDGNGEAPSHSELGAKLLRDAAAFFDTIAGQNPALAEQMQENASVFRQVAALLEADPLGRIAPGAGTPDGSDDE